ncbi:TolC family outer membrane protein [Epibacterium sp. SM1979]|uniref:TolC family outer membrane protein n=1 Tax=Tritonibacter litoralis TaxID=2662264 RepID=A0A843YAE6_9RHOB|nr:TolC family outer membrane protein [Tritonibacter litoralis]MQQ07906.1 TolC family outer membrane protein [Tritonibacter litoralis]
MLTTIFAKRTRTSGSKRSVRALALAGSMLAVLVAPNDLRADNLSDALIGAYKTSGLLEQNRALLRVADEDVASAVASMRPIVNWALTASHRYTRSPTALGGLQDGDNNTFAATINLSWVLWDGGQRAFTKRAAQEAVLATRQSLLDVEQQVLFSAVTAYVSVLFQEENVRLRSNNLRLLREELRAAQDRFEVGEVTRTDVALAESRVAGAQAELTQARGDLASAQAVYKQVVGREPGATQGQPPLPSATRSEADAQNLARRNHPSLLSQQHAVKSAELRVESTRSALGPSITLRGDLGHTQTFNQRTDTDTRGVSLELGQTIYAGGGRQSALRADRARLDAEKGVLITVQRQIEQGVSSAFASLNATRASLTSSEQQVRSARVAFDGVREEATLGARTTLDVLEAEQELLDAQVDRVQARANLSLAAYDLLQTQGLLTAEHLGLAVEIYDPTLYYNLVKGAPIPATKRGKDLDRVLKALGKQ